MVKLLILKFPVIQIINIYELFIKDELNIKPKIWSGLLLPTLPSPNCSNNLLTITIFLLTLKYNKNQYTHLDIPYVPTHDRKNVIFPILVSSALKMITSSLVVNFFKRWRESKKERRYMAHHSCQALSLYPSDSHYTSLQWVCQRHWSLSLSWLSRQEPFCLDLLQWCIFSDHCCMHCCCTYCSPSSLWLLFLFSEFLILEYNQWTIYYQHWLV